MIGFISSDKIEVGLGHVQFCESGLQGGEGGEGSGRGGDGEAREDEGGGESGGILSSLHTLDIAQLTAGLEKLGQQPESHHVMVDGRQSNTAGEDLVEVSWLVVGQTKSLNVLHVDLDGRSWHKIDITGLESE